MSVYSPTRADFSLRAHNAALSRVYAQMFPGAEVESYVDTSWDHDFGIDYVVRQLSPQLRASLAISFAERWRSPDAMSFRSVTITEWNLDTDRPSELHKTIAAWMLYGYYDDTANTIRAAYAVNLPTVLRGLANGTLPFTRQFRVDQSFLCIHIDALRAVGAIGFEV